MAYKFLVSLLILVACCTASSENPGILSFQDTAMTVPYKILVACPCAQNDSDAVQQIINTTFREIDSIYNKWNPQSELSAINKSPGLRQLAISKELYGFLELTSTYVELTEGRFDPTIEPVQRIWREAFAAGRLPHEDELASAAADIGWDKIVLADGFLQKRSDGVQLDLGGIAKGYAVDVLVDRLNAAGYKNVFVEWGGEIKTSGTHPDHRPWRIYISRLGDSDPERALATLEMEDSAVATSGDYLQQWTIGKDVYFHIIDPLTLSPMKATHTSVASVTVVARTCVEADVLATAAMLFPSTTEAEEWSKRHAGAQFTILSRQRLTNLGS